jgi:uncharacterized protein (TIGR00725 family)
VSRRWLIGVVGPAECDRRIASLAEEVGTRIAAMGAILVCGGRAGVMEAACRGAKQRGGLTIGILPTPKPEPANPYVDVAIATGLGQARNAVIAQTCDLLIAVGVGYGTLSEIALALRAGTPVIGLETWDIPGVRPVKSPGGAMELARRLLTPEPA